jgi:hypothetical protein
LRFAEIPTLPRRIARATAETASSCPILRCFRRSLELFRRSNSASWMLGGYFCHSSTTGKVFHVRLGSFCEYSLRSSFILFPAAKHAGLIACGGIFVYHISRFGGNRGLLFKSERFIGKLPFQLTSEHASSIRSWLFGKILSVISVR